jgi:hypothetical protein
MRIIYAIIIGGLVCLETGCKDKKDDKGVGGGAGGDGSGGAALGGGLALAADGGRTAPVVGGVRNLSPDVGKSRAEKIAEAKAAMDAAKMRLDNNADNLIPVNADLKSKRIALIDRLVGPPGLFSEPANVGYLINIVGLPIDRSGTTAQSIQA